MVYVVILEKQLCSNFFYSFSPPQYQQHGSQKTIVEKLNNSLLINEILTHFKSNKGILSSDLYCPEAVKLICQMICS